MTGRMAKRVCQGLIVGLFLVAASAYSIPFFGNKEPKKEVRDLHYGEVLYYFYQGDYFSALTRLRAARQVGLLPNHEAESELLLGGLYLSYGHHREAAEIFHKLLEDAVEESVADRTWFFLAKIWYQRGYYDEAEKALIAIQGKLPKELEAERQMLLAQVYMFDERFDQAVEVLDGWKGPSEWIGFARFNLGVALVRRGDVERGTKLLEKVGTMKTKNEESRSLRDKANLALGYAYLQAKNSTDATEPLQRVRLKGPFSNKALLGVGWAAEAEERHAKALVPWMELRGRNLLDPAVQESLLAIPYALGQMQANQQAAEHYLLAIEAFAEEMGRIDLAIRTVNEGRLMEVILADRSIDQLGWFWELDDIPDTPETRYLYHLLASHEFQESLKSYRDLKFMEKNLYNWSVSVEAFEDMLHTRRYAYSQRLPVINQNLARFDFDDMLNQRLEFESRLDTIEQSSDIAALATSEEQRNWAMLQDVEERVALFPNAPELDDARDKHRFLKGVMYWEMNKGFKARLWRARRGLKELETAFRETDKRRVLVERARESAPNDFERFESQISSIQPRISALQIRATGAVLAQHNMLEKQAIVELETQKRRLGTYMVQARFALASIYDRSANAGDFQ